MSAADRNDRPALTSAVLKAVGVSSVMSAMSVVFHLHLFSPSRSLRCPPIHKNRRARERKGKWKTTDITDATDQREALAITRKPQKSGIRPRSGRDRTPFSGCTVSRTRARFMSAKRAMMPHTPPPGPGPGSDRSTRNENRAPPDGDERWRISVHESLVGDKDGSEPHDA
jgi:hypothetical protein